MGGWVVNDTPRLFYPPGKETRYPMYKRLSGNQNRSGKVRKIPSHQDSIPDLPDHHHHHHHYYYYCYYYYCYYYY